MQAKWRTRWGVLLASLALPLVARADNPKNPAVAGTVNYVEGQAFLNGKELDAKSIGSVVVDSGQSVSTENGKVEVLLTPGVFLRLGNNSAARMVSAGLTNTEVALEGGQALLEVDQIQSANNLRMKTHGITADIEKTGLYEFDVDGGILHVFDGMAEVATDRRNATVKSGHELLFENGRLMTKKFDPKEYPGDDLYNWSSLRSSYLAEANVNEAGYYAQYGWVPGGPPWWGAGWYWDPWFDAFTYLPGDGAFFSPFGWGFYSPWCVYRAPFYGYGYGYGHFNYYRHFNMNPATWGPGEHYAVGQHYVKGTYTGPGAMTGAFHSAAKFSGGGFPGFHASQGGGFHSAFHGGGGFFGGFHGGASGSIGGHGK